MCVRKPLLVLGGTTAAAATLLTFPAAADPSHDGDPDRGRALYEKTCVRCHGADGTGVFAAVPDFTDRDGPLAQSDEVLHQHIKHGFRSPGAFMVMPAKGGNAALDDADIADIIAYLRRFPTR